MWPHIYYSTSDSVNRKNHRDWASGCVARRLHDGRNHHRGMGHGMYSNIIGEHSNQQQHQSRRK